MKFNDFAKEQKTLDESAVGMVGRTGRGDADTHLTSNPDLIRRFKKIVRELGGKTVAHLLLKKILILVLHYSLLWCWSNSVLLV